LVYSALFSVGIAQQTYLDFVQSSLLSLRRHKVLPFNCFSLLALEAKEAQSDRILECPTTSLAVHSRNEEDRLPQGKYERARVKGATR
jgi:hypothetical protein